MRNLLVPAFLALVLVSQVASAAAEPAPFVGDHYSVAVVAKHPAQHYFYFPPKNKHISGEGLVGLVIALPGGRGDEGARPDIGNIYLRSLPGDFALVQLINPIWRPDQKIMWPTPKVRTEGMEFSTPQFIDAVLDDVQKLVRVDPNRVYLMGRSSGGGATYYSAVSNPRIRGAFIEASVFKPEHLPSLEGAKGKRFFLYQSPTDDVTPFSFAEAAKQALSGVGAEVVLEEFEGGHYAKSHQDRMRTYHNAFRWLQQSDDACEVGAE